jgi:hypothetical protein
LVPFRNISDHFDFDQICADYLELSSNFVEQKPEPLVPLKSCLICSVAMQATKTDERIVHKCERCGMIITIMLPAKRDK